MLQIQALESLQKQKECAADEMLAKRGTNWRKLRKSVIRKYPEEDEEKEETVKGDEGEKLVEELRQDPLEELGKDIVMMILSNLDARSLALSLAVSRAWYGLACSDSLWSPKCEELWMGKAHIPRFSLDQGLSKLAAYSLSIMDSKRTRIMKEDLCDHAWEFHFNRGAPNYWRNLDPYWKGTGSPMRRFFHPDGSQTANPDDEVWGGHECCYSVVTSFLGEGTIRDHYVRINRWPRMSVSRKPDWSWEMSNHLYCYSSIPDAEKEGGTGPSLVIIYISPFSFVYIFLSSVVIFHLVFMFFSFCCSLVSTG